MQSEDFIGPAEGDHNMDQPPYQDPAEARLAQNLSAVMRVLNQDSRDNPQQLPRQRDALNLLAKLITNIDAIIGIELAPKLQHSQGATKQQKQSSLDTLVSDDFLQTQIVKEVAPWEKGPHHEFVLGLLDGLNFKEEMKSKTLTAMMNQVLRGGDPCHEPGAGTIKSFHIDFARVNMHHQESPDVITIQRSIHYQTFPPQTLKNFSANTFKMFCKVLTRYLCRHAAEDEFIEYHLMPDERRQLFNKVTLIYNGKLDALDELIVASIKGEPLEGLRLLADQTNKVYNPVAHDWILKSVVDLLPLHARNKLQLLPQLVKIIQQQYPSKNERENVVAEFIDDKVYPEGHNEHEGTAILSSLNNAFVWKLERMIDKAKSKIGTLTARNQQLSEELDNAISKLIDTETKCENKLRAFQDELILCEKKLALSKQELGDCQRQMDEVENNNIMLELEHKEAMNDLRREFSQALQEQREKIIAESRERIEDLNLKLEVTHAQYEEQLAELNQSKAVEVSQVQSTLQQQFNVARQQETDNLRRDLTTQFIAAKEEEVKEVKNQATQKHDEIVRKIQKEHQDELTRAHNEKNQLESEMIEIRTEYGKMTSLLQSSSVHATANQVRVAALKQQLNENDKAAAKDRMDEANDRIARIRKRHPLHVTAYQESARKLTDSIVSRMEHGFNSGIRQTGAIAHKMQKTMNYSLKAFIRRIIVAVSLQGKIDVTQVEVPTVLTVDEVPFFLQMVSAFGRAKSDEEEYFSIRKRVTTSGDVKLADQVLAGGLLQTIKPYNPTIREIFANIEPESQVPRDLPDAIVPNLLTTKRMQVGPKPQGSVVFSQMKDAETRARNQAELDDLERQLAEDLRHSTIVTRSPFHIQKGDADPMFNLGSRK